MLNIEKIAPFWFIFLYLEICAVIVLTFDHIGNVFLYFDLYGHGKLDLKFVHGREVCWKQQGLSKKVYISEAEENNRTTSFGEKGLVICGHIYLCNQLLPQINSCYQEVMQNNEMTSPWSNYCWMLVASRKTTTR